MKQSSIRTKRYRMRLTQEFMAQRNKLGQMTPQLLLIFADGRIDILKQLAAGLTTISPGNPDLPIIHATIHDMQSRTEDGRYAGGPGKGKRPIYSVPLKDIPQRFLTVIEESRYEDRLKRDLTYVLREILGAARRECVPEELTREALTAYRSELDGRDVSAKTVERKMLDIQRLGRLFDFDDEIQRIITNERRSAKILAVQEPSKRHAAFRENPISPLDYARIAQKVSEEAFATRGNRQTVQRLFVTAGVLSFLSFIPERVSDILSAVVGQDMIRDGRGWSSEYFSRKTGNDRTFGYLPDQMTPYFDDLILLGAKPGPQGRDLARLYRHRVSIKSPMFARTDLRRAYSPGRIFELVKERTGHGPHAARKAMTDYIAEIGGTPEDVLDLLGHTKIATSEAHYAVRAAAIKRKQTLAVIDDLRGTLAEGKTFRLPTGQLIDLDKIARDLDRAS